MELSDDIIYNYIYKLIENKNITKNFLEELIDVVDLIYSKWYYSNDIHCRNICFIKKMEKYYLNFLILHIMVN